METYGFKQRGSSRQATYRPVRSKKQQEDSAKLRKKRQIENENRKAEQRLIQQARFTFDNQQGDVEVPMNARDRRMAVQKMAQDSPQWGDIQKARSLGLPLSGLEEHEQGILDREAKREAIEKFGLTGKGTGGGVQVPSVKSREYDRVNQEIADLQSRDNLNPSDKKRLAELIQHRNDLAIGKREATKTQPQPKFNLDEAMFNLKLEGRISDEEWNAYLNRGKTGQNSIGSIEGRFLRLQETMREQSKVVDSWKNKGDELRSIRHKFRANALTNEEEYKYPDIKAINEAVDHAESRLEEEESRLELFKNESERMRVGLETLRGPGQGPKNNAQSFLGGNNVRQNVNALSPGAKRVIDLLSNRNQLQYIMR